MIMVDECEVESLESSIIGLDQCVVEIYKSREPRALYGPDSIHERTMGADFNPPGSFKKTYFDKKRGKEASTEFAEFVEALENYDKDPSEENAMDLLLEAGDILYQEAVVRVRHEETQGVSDFKTLMDIAFEYMSKQLESRGLSLGQAREITEIKYSIRVWLAQQGYKPNKDNDLEFEMCRGYLILH